MSERYDLVTAGHYAAYRPPLHREILWSLFGAGERFRSGLDVGCGTGYSAVALAERCERVCGLDKSREMLERAVEHPAVDYYFGGIDSFPELPGRPYDIVTFAGSLVYTKSEELREGLRRICAKPASVAVYDFDILLEDVMEAIGVPFSAGESDYDHDIGISDWEEFEPLLIQSERVELRPTPEQTAHLLLSDSFRYDLLREELGGGERPLFEQVCLELGRLSGGPVLEVRTWGKRYRVV